MANSHFTALALPLADRIDRLNTAMGRAASGCALAIVLIGFAVVLMRYVLALGSIWLQESILYAHAALFLLAAAWTLKEGGHVRVDVFYADASPRAKALVDLLGAALLLLPFCAAILYFSVPYVARSFAILERSREASGLPLVFLLKSLIPLFALTLALQGVAQMIRALAVLVPAAPAPEG
jgi:TRAP-type mannitol/chloroaromatic compound transport system permease small subunit